MTTQQMLKQAIDHYLCGQVDQAQIIYRQILSENPNHPDALNLLGLLLGGIGQQEEAARLIQRAIGLAPNFAPFHANLGETLRRQGKLDQAVSSCARAIELDPRLTEAHHNLSAALNGLHRFDEANAAARKALQLRPDYAEAHFNLANALNGMNRLDDAIAEYRRALELRPDYPDALINLGVSYQSSMRFDDAIAAFSSAVRLNPDSADAHNNLAIALDSRGRGGEALAAYAAAIKLNPTHMRALTNYGFALANIGRLDEALAMCTAAVRLKDADAEAYTHLGYVHKKQGHLEDALQCCSRAIEKSPGLAAAHNAMANILKDTGLIKESISAFRRAAQLAPTEPGFHSNLVYSLYFDPDCTPADLFAEHQLWARRYAHPFRPFILPPQNDRDPARGEHGRTDRRLRVGYVSPDFYFHPVGRFMLPLLAAHDHKNFEIYCYSSVKLPGPFTERLKEHADVWRDVRSLANMEVAQLIRNDQIDILVDLTMHMADNRLPLFARKPAPIQVTYLAYAGTTGLDTMDFRITDPHLDPHGSSEQYYSEKSIRLPKSYWCYEPPIENLPQSPLPSAASGRVTFGCLNNFCKISPATFRTWCRLLATVPESRLIIHADAGPHRLRIRSEIAQHGINTDRLLFVETCSLPGYMRLYTEIDIALDPFPYVGGTTTCDALWMGVPVVTLCGQTAISRGGVSILTNVGLPELIAQSTDEYTQIAAELANDRTRLARLRANLRDQMRASPLMDANRFARNMEAIYRDIWQKWCAAGR